MKKIFVLLLICGLAGWLLIPLQAQQDRQPDQLYTKIGENLYQIDRSIFPLDTFPDSIYDGMYIPEGTEPLCNVLHPEWFDHDTKMLNIDADSKLPDDDVIIQAECRMITLRSKTPDVVLDGDRGGVFSRVRGKNPKSESVNPSAVSQLDPQYRYAVNYLNCSGGSDPCFQYSLGLTDIKAIHSPYKPTVLYGPNSDYHFVNRTHTGGYPGGGTIQCQAPYLSVMEPNIMVGLHWGYTTEYQYYGSGMMIVWEKFEWNNCHTYSTGYAVSDYAGPILFRLSGNNFGPTSATWNIYAWINGAWANYATITTSWSTAVFLESGLETLTKNGAFTGLKVPLNFTHKLQIKGEGINPASYRSWDDNNLPTRYKNKSAGYYETPFSVWDASQWNWTSVAGTAN